MDAWVEPIKSDVKARGNEQWENKPNTDNVYSLLTSAGDKGIYQLNGTVHYDSPISRLLGITGKVNGRYDTSMQRDFILTFFDNYLKQDQALDLNLTGSKYQEAVAFDNKQ